MSRVCKICFAGLVLMVSLPASGKPFSCPSSPPATWNLADARLNSVRVLSFPVGEPPMDEQALPIMAPFHERLQGKILYQTWNMNFDAPRYKFQVDCLYSGTERFLRRDAPGVKQCVARSTPKASGNLISFTCH